MPLTSQAPSVRDDLQGRAASKSVRDLARQLVHHLGKDAARQTCQDNQWHGVMRAIDDQHS